MSLTESANANRVIKSHQTSDETNTVGCQGYMPSALTIAFGKSIAVLMQLFVFITTWMEACIIYFNKFGSYCIHKQLLVVRSSCMNYFFIWRVMHQDYNTSGIWCRSYYRYQTNIQRIHNLVPLISLGNHCGEEVIFRDMVYSLSLEI
jgi:hypothetical protein